MYANQSILTDFYELTMANGYFSVGLSDSVAYFDMFFRDVPDQAAYAIVAGLQQLIEYVQNLRFSQEEIKFLRDKGNFNPDFLEYLANFKFECDVWAVPEGTPVFPHEPIVMVRGPIIQAQLLETMLLLIINHQSLIATKANRITLAAQGRPIAEFGSRRAQGCDGALYGARAAYIGGAVGTSCTLAEQRFNVPVIGTMSHSWVQSFDNEYLAFWEYAKLYPNNCILLVDTYNTLESGVPNAIRIFENVLKPLGITNYGIRIDSGDITYLTKKIRVMLDESGHNNARIIVSNSLDEYIIRDIIDQGAQVDAFGVGERLITSKSSPIFGGVYKLVALENEGEIIPKVKISENVTKIINPYFKKVYRLFSKKSDMMLADVIVAFDEIIDESQEYELFHPDHIWKRKKVTNFRAEEILKPIFKSGRLVYKSPSLTQIRNYKHQCLKYMWEEVKRFENPQQYYVDLSKKLWNIKQELLLKNNQIT